MRQVGRDDGDGTGPRNGGLGRDDGDGARFSNKDVRWNGVGLGNGVGVGRDRVGDDVGFTAFI